MLLDESFGKSELSLTPRAKRLLGGQRQLLLGFMAVGLIFALMFGFAAFVYVAAGMIERISLFFGAVGLSFLVFALSKMLGACRNYQHYLDYILSLPDEPLVLEKLWATRQAFWQRIVIFWFWLGMSIPLFFWTKEGVFRSSNQVDFDQIMRIQNAMQTQPVWRSDSFLNTTSADSAATRRLEEAMETLRRQILNNNRPTDSIRR